MFLLTATFIWDEILLRIFSGAEEQPSVFYALLFAAATGLLWTSVFRILGADRRADVALGTAANKRERLFGLTACMLTASILIHFSTATAAVSGSYGSLYTSRFNFKEAVPVFGLDCATRLDLLYSILGTPKASFRPEMEMEAAQCNLYFTMGNQLQRLGYFSLAFHNGSHTFYHRNETHTQLGYDAYFASGQHLEDFCGQAYPTDTQMFAGTLPAYLGHQPFSVYFMTVSGHAPYEKNSYFVRQYYDRVNEICGDTYYEKTKYYICYQMELENALTVLVQKLEEAGVADDTVIVLTGDHYPYGLGTGKTWNNETGTISTTCSRVTTNITGKRTRAA